MNRNHAIDYLRASAIVLMVIFHFIWDLNYFGYISTDIPSGPFWREFRALIVSLFLFSMGVSLVYAYQQSINYQKLGLRLAKLIAAALVITLTTQLLMPKAWVYFGILHFIAFATVVLVGLVKYPNLSLVLSFLVLVVYWFVEGSGYWPFQLIKNYLPDHTVDLATPIPWLALPLFGIWASQFSLFRSASKNHPPRAVALLSKNSLIIYLLHQPVLFGLLHLYGWLSS